MDAARERVAWLALVLISAAILMPAPAQAQSGVDVSAVAGFDGFYRPGGWTPVSTVVESSQAISADLDVVVRLPNGTQTRITQPIEVPAGGRKQFDSLIPPGFGRMQVEISVHEGDDVLADHAVDVVAVEDALLVGTLGVEAPFDDGMRVVPTFEVVDGSSVDPSILSLGAGALDALSYLIASAADLQALAPEQSGAVLDWVASGGRLVAVAEDTGELEDVPVIGDVDWRSGSERTVAAGGVIRPSGLGEVIGVPADLTDIGDDAWTSILRPAPIDNVNDDVFQFPEFSPFRVTEAMRRTRERVRLSWFVIFLVAYLVMVGPVNYFLVRSRGRKELLWISIPVLSLAFSGVAYGLTRESRRGLDIKVASVVLAGPDGERGEVVASLSSGAGGRRSLGFTSPAASTSLSAEFFGHQQVGSTLRTDEGADVLFETSPFSVAVAHGALDDFEGFIDAVVLPGRTKNGSVEVTNRTPFDLFDVVVHMPTQSLGVGDVAAEDTVSLPLPKLRPDKRPDFQTPEPMQGALRSSLFGELRTYIGGSSMYNVPVVTGYTHDFSPEIRVDGNGTSVKTPTLIASAVRFDTDAAGTIDDGARLTGLSGTARFFRMTSLSLDRFREATFLYSLPAGVAPSEVAKSEFHIGRQGPGNLALDVYDPNTEEWRALGSVRNGAFDDDFDPGLFSEAGEVYFRASSEGPPFSEVFDLGVRVGLR